LRVRVLLIPPPVAVIVSVGLLVGAVDDAVKVSVVLPFPGGRRLAGLKLAFTPLGSPLIVNATAELNPFTTAEDTTMAFDAPRTIVVLEAPAVSVKLGAEMVRPKV
jgi:hypothetical protein